MGKFIRDYQVGKTFSKEEETFKPNRKKGKKSLKTLKNVKRNNLKKIKR
jgi:hypothetical protein